MSACVTITGPAGSDGELVSHYMIRTISNLEIMLMIVCGVHQVHYFVLCCADLVLGMGAMQPLLQLLSPEFPASRSMVRNATWTLSNFCRGKPAPDFEITKAALPTLRSLIMPSQDDNDEEIMTDACWALSYLSDGPNERIQVCSCSAPLHISATMYTLCHVLCHRDPFLHTSG
jgi:hypothetical protein